MANLLGLQAFGSTGFMQVVQINVPSLSTSALGGVLERSSKNNTAGNGHRADYAVCKFKGKVYAVVCNNTNGNYARVYRFIPDSLTNKVRKLRLTGNPSLAVAAGETVTGPGGSPATATVAENYQTGDLFVITTGGNGVDFQNNDSLTFSGGATATIAAAAGVEDNGGEWIEVFKSTLVCGVAFCGSGLHNFVNASGEAGLFFAFSASTTGTILVRTTDGISWSETTISSGTTSYVYQVQQMLNGVLHIGAIAGGNTSVAVAINPSTASYVNTTLYGPAGVSIQGMISAFGRVLVTSEASGVLWLVDITGGIINSYVTTHGSIPFMFCNVSYKGVNEDAIYIGVVSAAKLFMQRIALINGIPTWNGHTALSVSIGDKILPGSLLSGQPGLWGREFEEYESDPGVKSKRLLINSSATVYNTSFTSTEYSVGDVWQSLSGGVAFTWNGTVGNANDVVAITGHGLAVGDYILHVSSNKAFKVAAVATNNIQIENFSGSTMLPIPSTASETHKAIQGWSLVGGSTSNTSMPAGTRAGERMFTLGEISAQITASTGLLSAEEISFQLFNEGSAVGCKIAVYYEDNDGVVTQGTLTNPSVGAIVADENTGLTCDDGVTTYTVRASLPPSGFKDRFLVATAT